MDYFSVSSAIFLFFLVSSECYNHLIISLLCVNTILTLGTFYLITVTLLSFVLDIYVICLVLFCPVRFLPYCLLRTLSVLFGEHFCQLHLTTASYSTKWLCSEFRNLLMTNVCFFKFISVMKYH